MTCCSRASCGCRAYHPASKHPAAGEPAPNPAQPPPPGRAVTSPAARPGLRPAEAAYLARMTIWSPRNGERLANICRARAADHVSDTDIARILIAVHQVETTFSRRAGDPAATLAIHVDALGAAAAPSLSSPSSCPA